MSPALLVGVSCFLGTLGVAMLAWLAADYENRRVGHRQFEYERRLQWRIDRAPEDRDYLLLHGIAADMLRGPYDQTHPLNAALSETGMERPGVARPTLAALRGAPVSLSGVEPGPLPLERGAAHLESA